MSNLVTLESALDAISHVERHNGPGRASQARKMLEQVVPNYWIVEYVNGDLRVLDYAPCDPGCYKSVIPVCTVEEEES